MAKSKITQKTDNVEELQLLVDKFQNDNKKLLSEQTEMATKILFLSEQLDKKEQENKELNEEIDELTKILKKNAIEFSRKLKESQKNQVIVASEVTYKYKLRDSVFYIPKHGKTPFWVSKYMGEMNDEPVYRLVSDNGSITEAIVKESDISPNTAKIFNKLTEFKIN